MLKSIKHIIQLSAILLVLLGLQSQLFVTALFVQQQDYIANVLCENRGNPDMDCGGACFLMKHSIPNVDTPTALPEFRLPTVLSTVMLTEPANNDAFNGTNKGWSLTQNISPAGGFPTGIFHPPRMA